MCLAVPARITKKEGQMATVEVGGLVRQASLALLPYADMGDYVLVHAGFAISIVDEEEARETLTLFDDLIQSLESESEKE